MANFRAVKTFVASPFAQAPGALRDVAIRLKSQGGDFNPKTSEFRLPPTSLGEPLEFSARLRIDLQAVRNVLPGPAPFRCALVLRNNASRLSRLLYARSFPVTDTATQLDEEQAFTVPAEDTGRDLTLSVIVALDAKAGPSAGKAQHPASVLSEKRFSVTSRVSTGIEFPNKWVSFSDEVPTNKPNALWHLKVPASINESPQDSFYLELNKDIDSFVTLLSHQHTHAGMNATRKVLLATIEESTLVTFLSWALRSPEIPPSDEDERVDTMWPVVLGICEKVDPDWDDADAVASLKGMRDRYASSPQELQMVVQAYLNPRKRLDAILSSLETVED